MATLDPDYLMPRHPEEPRTQRLGMGKNFLWLLAGVAGTAVVAVLWFSYTKQAPQVLIQEAKPPTRSDLMASPAASDGVLPFQQQYLGHSREVLVSSPSVRPAAPKPEPFAEPVVTPLPPAVTAAALTPSPFRQDPVVQAESKKTEEKKAEKESSGAAQNTPPKKPPPQRWLNDAQVPVAKPVFPVEKPREEKAAPAKEVTSSLVKPVPWAQLAHPAYALYRTQTIHGILTHNVNSDVPGQVKILVTRPVIDEQGQGVTVIPQFSYLLGTQTGKVSYGASRLDVTIEQLQTPEKIIIDLGKAKLADKSGAVGGDADVDAHLGRVILGAGISAVLSIGARSVGGSPSGFQPNLGQDFARDAAGSINASGQRIVEQQISIAPTLTLKAGEPITIQLLENYSFQHPPVTITK